MMSLSQLISRKIGLDPTGSLTPDDARAKIQEFYSGPETRRRWNRARRTQAAPVAGRLLPRPFRVGLGEALGRGALSAILPMETIDPDFMRAQARGVGSSMNKGLMARVGSYFPASVRSAAKKFGGHALRWIGPVITGSRLATETQGLGLGGGVGKGIHIVGEEMAWSAGFGLGATLGPAMAAALGVVGSAAGPVGTVLGMAAGFAIGGALAYGTGKLLDIAEAPIRVAHSGWNYLRDLGKRTRGMELGGSLSAGNRSMAAATMRQRALQQMSRSGINARTLLGREATMMHMPA